MCPILFHFGPLTVYSYGLMFALAVVTGTWLLSREASRRGVGQGPIDPEIIFDLAFWIVLSGIIGARAYYLFLYPEVFKDNWLEIFMLQHGGLAFQGGFILVVPVTFWFLKKKGLPILPMIDLMAPYAALAQAIGRIGCFLNGCCYGREVSWGIYFPVHEARLHPTQLYETAGLLAAFFILRKFQSLPHRAGQIFAWYLILAGIERFVVEFFRDDHAAMYGSLSNFQVISLGVIAAGILMHGVIKIKKT